MSEVLGLSGVEKTYNAGQPNALTVLQDVDLSLGKGEIIALVAPSGAGKSTLLHIAGLLDTPSTGEVRIGGEAVKDRDDKARTELRRDRIGFVYQFHHLLPEFSAHENVMIPQRAAACSIAEAATQAEALLTLVGLKDRANHRPAELSGGEQQRVAICRALANAPNLLLADEPTGNLDPDTAEGVFQTLLSLARETGLTALIATHNHALAERMDRIIRLQNGRIVS